MGLPHRAAHTWQLASRSTSEQSEDEGSHSLLWPNFRSAILSFCRALIRSMAVRSAHSQGKGVTQSVNIGRPASLGARLLEAACHTFITIYDIKFLNINRLPVILSDFWRMMDDCFYFLKTVYTQHKNTVERGNRHALEWVLGSPHNGPMEVIGKKTEMWAFFRWLGSVWLQYVPGKFSQLVRLSFSNCMIIMVTCRRRLAC